MIEEKKREAHLAKLQASLTKAIGKMNFKKLDFIPISANERINIDMLIKRLVETTSIPDRNPDGKLLFLIDHCFALKGKGTVGNLNIYIDIF